MKSLKCIVVASLALASSLAARADSSAKAWLENYYLNPQPAALAPSIRALSREGFFEEPGNVAVSIGFLGTVFAKNPERVDGWLLQLNGLPLAHHRILAAALWQAGNPLGSDMLRNLGKSSRIQPEVEKLATNGPVPIVETPVLSSSSMNLQWGAFLASGDNRHIVSILDAIGSDRPGLDASARNALARNAATHSRVMEICQMELARQPEEVRSEIRAALTGTSAGKPRT